MLCFSILNSTKAQADDGYLYPLERAFFYVNKPPLLLLHEDVEAVEFCRQGGGGAVSTKTFDLAIRDRNDQVGFCCQPRGVSKHLVQRGWQCSPLARRDQGS